jgi:4,5-dihydroxyphthalate decarboxylase
MNISGDDYPATRQLSGPHAGFTFDYTPRPLMEAMADVLANRPFQVCEFSLSYTIQMIDQGNDWITPVPVFPLRAFRHTAAYVRRDSYLTGAAGLEGKRIGVLDYSMTGAVWLRGVWREHYGTDWTRLKWYLRPVQRIPVPPGIDATTQERDLEEMLIAGELDILIGLPEPRDLSKPARKRRLRPLFADAAAAQMDYVASTGFYPIAHTVVLHSDVAANAGAARAVFDAYAASKRVAYENDDNLPASPWPRLPRQEFLYRFDGDPMIYGLTDTNRAIVDTLAGYLHAQNLTRNLITSDAIFTGGSADWREA